MLEFPKEDFIPAIITKRKGVIKNMLNTNENGDSLSKGKDDIKKNLMKILELKYILPSLK